MHRNRFHQLLLIAVTVVLGLSSRNLNNFLPAMVADYISDTLWALMVFFLAGFIFPSKSTLWVAASALLFSYLMELSQLYHSPFIDSIRATTIGGLIFGYTFVWSDLLCYNMGILIGMLSEKLSRKT